MSLIKKIFEVVATIFGTKIGLFGYRVSFLNIFAFMFLGYVVSIFISHIFGD